MWQKTEKSLHRNFEFANFDEAFAFIQKVADIARRHNHHPKITNVYSKVELELSTHAADNVVTSKDELFAKEVDELLSKPEKTLSMIIAAKLYTDGGSRGNPGPSAMGIVLLSKNDEVIVQTSGYIGVTTNNQAEYQALKKGLEIALEKDIKQLSVFMDSELIIKQINGQYKVKNADLAPHYQAIKQFEKKFEQISFEHVPRAKNKLADAMVNDCLDRQAEIDTV
jgi:ribonuclease HI/pterin-4a-carbinolamine dehydratase